MAKFTWEEQRSGLLIDLAASLTREDALTIERDKYMHSMQVEILAKLKVQEQLAAAQAQVEVLREALHTLNYSYVRLVQAIDEHDRNDPEEKLYEVTKAIEALAITPSDALREHDAKLVERIASRHDVAGRAYLRNVADNIRKGDWK
jgi:uncharacterized protein YecE (DUF72 family)